MVEQADNNAFMVALRELQAGQTLNDLHHNLVSLVGDVRSLGKPGTLTLTIKVTPKANSQQLVISDDVKVAPPKPERDITILFADDNNRLSRRDPRQPRLSGVEGEVRPFNRPIAVNENVDPGTGEFRE